MRRATRRSSMPINLEITDPNVLTMGQAAAFVADTTGVKPHVNTIMRWVLRGVGGQRLPASRVGRLWVTRQENVVDFLERCNRTSNHEAVGSEDIRRAKAALASRRHSALASELGLDGEPCNGRTA